jgi:hypothetical protein
VVSSVSRLLIKSHESAPDADKTEGRATTSDERGVAQSLEALLVARLVIIVYVAATLLGGSCSRGAHGAALIGTWTADVSRSKPSPENMFQSAEVTIDVAEHSVTITNHIIKASGQPVHDTATYQIDGKEHAVDSDRRFASVTRWVNANTLETVGKMGDQIVTWITYEASANGRTLTVRAPYRNDQNGSEFMQEFVYTRKQ